MSREIKFRAWDRKLECMSMVTVMDFPEWWIRDEHSGEQNSFKNEETDRHLLMQYTGKKDKNETDSYGQDIILYENDYPYNPETGKTSADINNDIALIYWNDDECGFWVKTDEKARDQIDMPLGQLVDEYGDFEIIGNVHQTPELMENKQ